jgi:hypothetical protein
MRDTESATAEELRKLLNYFGLDEYTGMIPILKKFGSDTTALTALLFCSKTLLHASPWI